MSFSVGIAKPGLVSRGNSKVFGNNTSDIIKTGILPSDSVHFAARQPVQPVKPFKLKRLLDKPILGPNTAPGHEWEGHAICNPAATKVKYDGKDRIAVLYRAIEGPSSYPDYPFKSRLGLSIYELDGKTLYKRLDKPVLERPGQYDGLEDPRITPVKINGETVYLIPHVQYEGDYAKIWLASTKDFKTFEQHGQIGPNVDDKDAYFHPERVMKDGKLHFMFTHRIIPNMENVFVKAGSVNDILSQMKDKQFWEKELEPETLEKNTMMFCKPGSWENKLGGGAPPIKTKDGWLLIYHASNIIGEPRTYRGGVALLDLKEPWKVIAKSPLPIIEPELPWEKEGWVDNVVFPQGVVRQKDKLIVYYGAADKYIGVAECSVKELLGYVKQFDADGNPVSSK
jgi:beta-1,2-mannobiose phosphorylase / 1,2-beta-oligomannan phosphorylase